MDHGPPVHIELDVALDGGTVSGCASADGAPPRSFVGWIGLNTAIDRLLVGDVPSPLPQGAPVSPDTSAPIVIGPITVTFSVLAEHSGGSVTISRCDVPGGAGMPVAHSHDAFEETLYGLEGVTTLVVDGERTALGPGDTFCIRRVAVHTFAADQGDAAFLAIATPGVFGPEYFLELKAVVDGATGPPDPQEVMAVMERHGLTPAPGG